GTAFLWHGRPLKKAKNGVHLNLGGHHRLKRWHQEGVLPGRLPSSHHDGQNSKSSKVPIDLSGPNN
ncbi:hypothetical protein, partial [Pseudomonas mucidolens]|uniref:hypothetical protein n=1 Tax=Pseudomonas mucidolens TaxID=46679 RepID=UPI0030DA9EF0